jgi:hypothetical protein
MGRGSEKPRAKLPTVVAPKTAPTTLASSVEGAFTAGRTAMCLLLTRRTMHTKAGITGGSSGARLSHRRLIKTSPLETMVAFSVPFPAGTRSGSAERRLGISTPSSVGPSLISCALRYPRIGNGLPMQREILPQDEGSTMRSAQGQRFTPRVPERSPITRAQICGRHVQPRRAVRVPCAPRCPRNGIGRS